MSAPRSSVLGFAIALLLVAACKPDREAFIGTAYRCDASSVRPGCGTTEDGTALTCFGGKQLGAGEDFCVEPCAGESPTSETGASICLKNSKLRTCKPSEPDGCGKGLGCLRTDLTRDQGVCLAMNVCSVDEDCRGGVLNTCGSTVLKAMFPRAPFQTSNLQCVATACKARGTGCPQGESCLPLLVPPTTPVPDICVPNCDSDRNCPPNYTCWPQLSGPGSPDICIPTLPGSRCKTSLDCWAGDCLDTGEGFSVCALPCERDVDCVPYSDSSHRQYCARTREDRRYCMPVSPFAGALCVQDSQCPQPASPSAVRQRCFRTSPYWQGVTPLGECRMPCEEETGCSARGGLPHACFVRGGDRSCYPGVLGVTCRRSEECLAGRTCETLPAEEGAVADAGAEADAGGDGGGDGGLDGGAAGHGTRVCTSPCRDDADCVDGWGTQEGYCAAGWCRLGHNVKEPCMRDQQCGSNRCEIASAGAPGVCVKRAP
jgi:hypothetical protein